MGRSVAVVLITYQSARFLRRCHEGLSRQTLTPAEVVVIDNASVDGSREVARELFREARLIENAANLGFAAAANQGIAATTAEYVLLLNPDVHLEAEYLERAVDALEERWQTAGAATGKLLRGQGERIEPTSIIDSKGIRMTRSGRHFDIGNGEEDRATGEGITEVFGVSGAAAVYRRGMLRDVAIDGKSFDESFFVYREDADLAWRSRLLGWKALYVPNAVAYHVRTVTPEVRRSLPPEINMHSVKNRFLLRLKNEGGYLARRNLPFELARDLIVLAATMTVERTSFPAWRWLWQHRREILASRRQIQMRRRISDRDLARWFE